MIKKIKEGHCLLEVKSKWKDREGMIWIPEEAKSVKGKVGKCVQIEPWKLGKKYNLWLSHKNKKVAAAKWNKIFEHMEGKYVVAETGVEFNYEGQNYFLVRLEHVAAILPSEYEEDMIEVAEEEIERCRYCKSAGEGNILMDRHGYCLQCGKNSKGEHKKDRVEKITDEMKYEFGATAEELAQRNDPNRRRESSKVISISSGKFHEPKREVDPKPFKM